MYKSGDITQFKQLSQFTSLEQFNNSIEQFLLDSTFTKGETVAFKRLVRYAAKIVGVCYAKIQTIVSATHNQGIGISRSTFERMLRKAKRLGIVQVHNTMKRGWKGHNVYVFQPYIQSDVSVSKTNEVSQNETIDVSNKTSNPIKTNKISNNVRGDENFNQGNDFSSTLDSSFTPTFVNKSFREICLPFLNARKITQLWKRVTIAYNKADLNMPIEHYMDQIVRVFKTTVFAKKSNMIRTTFTQYFYGGLKNVFFQIRFNEIHSDPNSVYYNWLEA